MQSIICLYMVKFVMLQRSHIAGKNLPSLDIFFHPRKQEVCFKNAVGGGVLFLFLFSLGEIKQKLILAKDGEVTKDTLQVPVLF